MVVRTLLNAGAKVNATNTIGRTALWLAASRGHEETVTYLLTHDADPALVGADGQSPLHVAAYQARPGSLRALLARKPPLNHTSRIGTPLHAIAAGPMLRSIASSQIRVGSSTPRVSTAADIATCAKLLVEAGAPLDALESNGLTPAQAAAAFGNRAVLEVLLATAPAALTARDAQGLTLLHQAARGPLVPGYTPEAQPTLAPETLAGSGEVIALLLERGARTNVKDQMGLTPLHHAAGAGNGAALKALLAAKADVRAVDNAGSTPLHWAAARGRVDAAHLLLATHAGRDVADGEGQTPLHMAVAAGHTEVARVLLEAGAEPNLANRRGQNALAYADAYNRPEIARLLRQYGAKAQLAPHSSDQL
jgi:ankyrin repeat protein